MRSFLGILVFSVICTGLAPIGAARAQTSLVENALDLVPDGEESDFGFRNGSLILTPVPFSNPTIGDGIAGGAAWLFEADGGSSTSSIGAGGFLTSNESSGFAFGANLTLNENRYLISLLAGHVDLNYDFTAGPFDFPVKQTGDLFKLELAYGFTSDFSMGFGSQYAETELSTTFGALLPPEYAVAVDFEVLKVGLIAKWDRRDSDLYPTTGTLVSFDAYQGRITGGTGADYRKAVVQGSFFRPGIRENDVIAVSATACTASDQAPFFDACSIGLTDGLRGFSVTEYIGTGLVSAQAEHRGRIGNGRFGYVAFAGASSVNGTQSSTAGIHGAAGIGARYRLSRDYPVDFSIDATINSDGDALYYIFIGQAF